MSRRYSARPHRARFVVTIAVGSLTILAAGGCARRGARADVEPRPDVPRAAAVQTSGGEVVRSGPALPDAASAACIREFQRLGWTPVGVRSWELRDGQTVAEYTVSGGRDRQNEARCYFDGRLGTAWVQVVSP